MIAEAEHSLLSASSAPRWTRCYGSVALESTQPNEGSKYADEGTAAHALAAKLLGGDPWEFREYPTPLVYSLTAADWIGETITVKSGRSFIVDAEFAGHVQTYVDYVRSLGGVQIIETRVNYANWLGVPEPLAWGTSDAIVVHDGSEVVFIDAEGYTCGEGDIVANTGRLIMTAVDLKFGAGVPVYPSNNEQAMLYTGGALNEIDLLIEVRNEDIVRIVIHQPRIGEGEPLEWYITVGELKNWLRTHAAMAAQHAVKLLHDLDATKVLANAYEGDFSVVANELTPGDKQCRFCNAKAVCPALTSFVVQNTANAFSNLDEEKPLAKRLSGAIDVAALSHVELAEKMKAIPLIEATIKAWQARAETLLLAGEPVPGLKLVRGKKGSRAWANIEAAAKRLKTYLGSAKAMKPAEPISPTQAEKLLSPKQYAALQKLNLITQSEGGIHVAPEDDPRETYVPQEVAQAAFAPIEEGDADDLSHLA